MNNKPPCSAPRSVSMYQSFMQSARQGGPVYMSRYFKNGCVKSTFWLLKDCNFMCCWTGGYCYCLTAMGCLLSYKSLLLKRDTPNGK